MRLQIGCRNRVGVRRLGCLGDVERGCEQRICSPLFRLLELWRGSGSGNSFGLSRGEPG